MIEKPSILVTSLGRTGTQFFARLFAGVLPGCTALHEPDIVQFAGVNNRVGVLGEQLKRAGVWRMLVLKALGRWTLVSLSDNRLRGKLGQKSAIRALTAQRQTFVERLPGQVYMEANFGYYGLIDIARDVFRHHRLIYVVRDGRDWVASEMNWGESYSKRGPRSWLGHKWPAAPDIAGDPYCKQWSEFSLFEKYCWAWSTLNQYALTTMKQNSSARLFFFEKIYSGAQRYEYLHDMLHFAIDMPGIQRGHIGKLDTWLDRKTHASQGTFPQWSGWTAEQKRQFDQICGPLMERLGYVY